MLVKFHTPMALLSMSFDMDLKLDLDMKKRKVENKRGIKETKNNS